MSKGFCGLHVNFIEITKPNFGLMHHFLHSHLTSELVHA